jgi:hypothetical protein
VDLPLKVFLQVYADGAGTMDNIWGKGKEGKGSSVLVSTVDYSSGQRTESDKDSSSLGTKPKLQAEGYWWMRRSKHLKGELSSHFVYNEHQGGNIWDRRTLKDRFGKWDVKCKVLHLVSKCQFSCSIKCHPAETRRVSFGWMRFLNTRLGSVMGLPKESCGKKPTAQAWHRVSI